MATTPEEQAGSLSLNDLLRQQRVIVNDLNTATQTRIRLLAKVGDLTDEERTQLEEANRLTIKLTANQKIFQNEIKKVRDELKLQIGYYSTAESSISSLNSAMGSMNDDLKKATQLGLDFTKSIENSVGEQRESFKQANEAGASAISSIGSLAQLNKEDAAQREEYIKDFQNQQSIVLNQIAAIKKAKADGNIIDEDALNILEKQAIYMEDAFKKASKFSNMQKDVKELYEEMNEELETGNKFFQKLINYGKVFFSSWKGAMTVIGFAAGYVVDEFGKINAKIGGGFQQLVGFKTQLTAISLILGEEAVGAVTEFGARIGNVNKISNKLAFDLSLLPSHLGVSGEEAGKLVNQFGKLSGRSNEFALNALEATSQLAAANGVAPSQVMKDVAENTEFFAKYAKAGGKNISDAAIEAARLGVDLSTAAEISDGLLDYQTSVAAEMEASVILGRNLNLQRARELAFQGKGAEAMKEAIKQAGTLSELEAMNPIEREALAKAIGVTGDKLRQMIANEKEALKPVGMMDASFNSMSAGIDYIGTTGMGKWIGGLGGAFIKVGQIANGLKALGPIFAPLIAKAKAFFGLSQFKGGSFSAGKEALAKSGRIPTPPPILPQTSMATPLKKDGTPYKRVPKNKLITPPANTPPAGPQQSMLSRFGSAGQIAAMAGVLLAFAAAIFILSKAFQNFAEIPGEKISQTMGLFAAAIGGIAIALVGLSFVGEIAGPAIIAMLALSAAVMGVGYGLSLMANSFKDANLDKMLAFSTGMLAFAGSVLVLAGALSLLSNPASLIGLGVLAATGVAAIAIGSVGSKFSGDTPNSDTLAKSKTNESEDNPLIAKIQALTDAILNQDIILKLNDDVIAKTVRRQSAKTMQPK
jgi:hypothetical protein